MSARPPEWLFALPWDLRRPGGVDQVVLNLYREMSSRNDFVPAVFVPAWEFAVPAESVDDGRPTFRMRLRSPSSAANTLRFLATLPRALARLVPVLRAREVRVVNVHFPGLWALAFVLAKRWLGRNFRVVLSFHGLDIVTAHETRGLARWWWRRLMRGADLLAACSDDLAAQVRAFDNESAARVVTIHNGLDVAAFLAEERPGLSLDPRIAGRRYVLCVAAYEPKKALDVLIRAFALLNRDEPDVFLVIVGVDRGLHEEMVRLASSLDLRDRMLTFLDVPHAELHPFYRHAAVFCLTSRSEPFGLVLLEAGAFALPVVASRVGGIPEVVIDGECGRLVSPGDCEGFARALREILAQPDDSARLGRALARRVSERFTWCEAYGRYRDAGTAARAADGLVPCPTSRE